ncbi:hypothetical protein SPHV1_2430011 [Novosphingobium sp. KN65.2]|nr:hypothetical protein SPHV1_2430011 [Novosphingobium sp. KN65.2]
MLHCTSRFRLFNEHKLVSHKRMLQCGYAIQSHGIARPLVTSHTKARYSTKTARRSKPTRQALR